MLEDSKKDITKMMVPIGGITILIIAAIVYGGLSKQVEINTSNVRNLQVEAKDTPTRNEFNNLVSSISEIKKGVDELRDYILKK